MSTSGVSDRSSRTTEGCGSIPATASMIDSRTEATLAKKSISSGRTMTRPGTAAVGSSRRSTGSMPPVARPRKVRRPSLVRQTRTARETATAIASASSVGMTRTPTSAIIASQKSIRRSSHSRRILPTFIIPVTATITIAPSVASGSGSNSGVRKSATRAVAAAAVTRDAGVFAPARSLAADFESDDPIGNPVNRPAPVFDAPMAISSRLGSILPPCARANSLAGPMASAKATSAIPTAPANRSGNLSSPTPGRVGPRRPAGRSPTTWTPWASRPKTTDAAIDARSTTRAAGTRGSRRSSTTMPAIPARPTARVSRSVSRSWGMIARTRSTALSPCASIPRSFGICLIEISSASPKTNPISTDSEKNCAMRPSFSAPAAIDTRPARIARAAVRAAYSTLPAAASPEMVAADMIAMADDTATTSWRELPSTA